MKNNTRYSPEMRERAVRMVFEHHAPSLRAIPSQI